MEKNKNTQDPGGKIEQEKKPGENDVSDAVSATSSGSETDRSGGIVEKATGNSEKKNAVPAAAGVANRLREFRIENMMSKAELARKAGLSVLTVARIEKGYGCRMDTKRKILKALGLKLADRRKVFEDD